MNTDTSDKYLFNRALLALAMVRDNETAIRRSGSSVARGLYE